MNGIHLDPDDPRIVEAVEELKQTILHRFPDAELSVGCGDDPVGVYIQATVDIDDLDEVIDAVIDQLLDIEVERGLPVYVVPSWPSHRVSAWLREREQQRAASLD